ncbi:MAG: MFS transporter [Tissierellia bacterium]|nr:MFS transporter [Tissierellia bacterium]
MKFLSPLERNWVLYDVGNSAFILMVTTVLPVYFRSLTDGAGLSGSEYFSAWGMAMTLSTLLIVLFGPLLGRLADQRGRREVFLATVVFAVAASLSFPFFSHWRSFLVAFILAKAGYNASLIVYDSMLVDVTSEERMDRVSAMGYAFGYIGSVIPFLMSLALILFGEGLGLSMKVIMPLVFLINGLWWLFCSLPLAGSYRQVYRESASLSWRELFKTFGEIPKNPPLFLFLLSFFFYIDGVYTIINMATAYGESLGLDSTGLLLALLVTQIVAFPASLTFGVLSKRVPSQRLIFVAILAYAAIALFAVQLDTLTEFWILAVAVGCFQGGIQALSRSHYAKLIPQEQSGEYFGIYDIFGKGASILGTFLVSSVTAITGTQSVAIGALALLFLVGLILFAASLRAAAR